MLSGLLTFLGLFGGANDWLFKNQCPRFSFCYFLVGHSRPRRWQFHGDMLPSDSYQLGLSREDEKEVIIKEKE